MSRPHVLWALSCASVVLLPTTLWAATPARVSEICRKEAVVATRSVRPIGRRHALLDTYVRQCVARPAKAGQPTENNG
jgi:hypothetical protein